MRDCFVVEHNYCREERENTAWHYIEGYLVGKSRSVGLGFTLENMKAGDGVYYIATAFMKGYRQGLSEPYYGKLRANYCQKRKWQMDILSQVDLGDLV